MRCNMNTLGDSHNVFKYVTMKGAKATLLNRTIQFTHPKDLNDPFDCLPAQPCVEEAQGEVERFKGGIAHPEAVDRNLKERAPNHYLKLREGFEIALSSFSDTKENLLMWSHYADSFKGCCLEFNPKQLLSSLSLVLPKFFPVTYDDKRPPMPVDGGQSSYKDEVLSILLTKSTIWEYEHEKRLFMSTSTDSKTYTLNGKWYRQFSEDALVSVSIGICASENDIEDITSLCKRLFPQTTVYRTSPDHEKFEVKFSCAN